jgi:AcrR family transcriptional regulator
MRKAVSMPARGRESEGERATGRSPRRARSSVRRQVGSSSPPRRGRPPSEAVTGRILTAAAEIFSEGGPRALSFVGVASRAGVSRGSLYRRWPDPQTLLIAAVSGAAPPVRVPQTGSVRGDLVALVQSELAVLAEHPFGRLLARAVSELRDNASLLLALEHAYGAPRVTAVASVVRAGKRRGELRTDVEPELVTVQLGAPALLRCFFGRPLGPEDAEPLVDGFLDGLRPRGRERPRRAAP